MVDLLGYCGAGHVRGAWEHWAQGRAHSIIAQRGDGGFLALAYAGADDIKRRAASRDGISLIWDGRIDNADRLRDPLLERGLRSVGDSDDALIIQAYLAWGDAIFAEIEGAWSLALHDANTGRLVLARDRFGQRPLCYRQSDGGLWFGSTPAALAAASAEALTTNQTHLARFLVNGPRALHKTTQTFFADYHNLPGGHRLDYCAARGLRITRYWQPQPRAAGVRYAEAVRGVHDRLAGSVEAATAGLAEAGCVLPGALAGAVLVGLAAAPAGPGRSNCKAARPCVPLEPEADGADPILVRLAGLTAHGQAPVLTPQCIIRDRVYQHAAAAGITTVLDPLGADEIFGGHTDHYNFLLYQLRRQPFYQRELDAWHRHIRPRVRNTHLRTPELFLSEPEFRGHLYMNKDVLTDYMTAPFDEPFEERHYSQSLLRNRLANELCHETVPPALDDQRLVSERHGIAVHNPYLRHAVVDFALALPSEHLIRDGFLKAPLRDAFADLLSPARRQDRWDHAPAPTFEQLFNLDDDHTREWLMDDGPVFDLVDRDRFAALLSAHDRPQAFSPFLFAVASARCFLENFG